MYEYKIEMTSLLHHKSAHISCWILKDAMINPVSHAL